MQQKVCSICNKKKPLEGFHKNNLTKTKTQPHCKICQKDKDRQRLLNDPLWARRQNLRRDFGMTIQQYESMLKGQNQVCAICKKREAKKFNSKLVNLAVDHCHKTSKIRGLLCHGCNTSLGHFGDSIELLEAAISYLKLHSGT